jgi:hypothetical protein
MAGTTFKRKDLNRFRKVYRYIRKKPKYVFTSDKSTIIESGHVDFSNESTKTYTFTEVYSSAPHVTATSVDNLSNSQANVNVFITSVTTTTVTFEISAPASCRVHFHAILIGP